MLVTISMTISNKYCMELLINSKTYNKITKSIILLCDNPTISDKYHYCYEIYVPSTEWIYRGVRSSKDWTKDKYLGSSKYHSYKDDINKSKKVEFRILSFHSTRKEANERERELVNEDFINRKDVYNLCLPSGNTWSHERVTVVNNLGETFSIKKSDPEFDKYDALSKNAVVVKDELGNTFRVPVDDQRYINGELAHISKGTVVVKSKEGKNLRITKEEFDTDKSYESIHKNLVMVKDKNGKAFKVPINDERYINGELVGITSDMFPAKDKDGNKCFISNTDDRYLEGELVHSKSNKPFLVNNNNGEVKSLLYLAEKECMHFKTLMKRVNKGLIHYSIYEPNSIIH